MHWASMLDLAQHNLPFANTCNHRLQGLLSKLFKSPKHCGMQPTRQLCPRASEKNTIPIASQQHLLQHALTAAAASNRQRAAASSRSSKQFRRNHCRSRNWRLSLRSSIQGLGTLTTAPDVGPTTDECGPLKDFGQLQAPLKVGPGAGGGHKGGCWCG